MKNMKRSHLVLIAIAVIAVLMAALLMPKHTAHNADEPQVAGAPPPMETTDAQQLMMPPPGQNMDAALVIDGTPVDPLCFLNRTDEEDAAFILTGCDGPDIVADADSAPAPLGGEFVSTGYSMIVQNEETDEQERYPGFIGYRYLGELDGHKAIWLVENGGGSGVFTTLLLADYDARAGQLVPRKIIASGDRCNGGIAAADIGGGMMVYEQDVTPYAMLGLTGEPGRAILQSEAAEQIPFCAACCYGRAQYAGGNFRGVRFDERLPEAIATKTYAEGAEAEKCFDELVTLYVGQKGQSFFDAAAFAAFVEEVEDTCLAPQEGE